MKYRIEQKVNEFDNKKKQNKIEYQSLIYPEKLIKLLQLFVKVKNSKIVKKVIQFLL